MKGLTVRVSFYKKLKNDIYLLLRSTYILSFSLYSGWKTITIQISDPSRSTTM